MHHISYSLLSIPASSNIHFKLSSIIIHHYSEYSYYSLWDNNCQQPVAYNYFNSKYCLNTIANQASSQLTCQGIKTYSTLNCISASVSSSVPSAHFNCNSSTSIIQTDSSLLASSFCNIFHTLEPTSLPSVEPTMTPSSATPILPSKMPHSPSYAPIWLTKTGWSSFNFYSSSDCITSSFIATESVQSNLCIATTYGSYKYRFQQSISNDFEILFSNYSDNNCKNTRFYNHYPSYLPIQSCIPVSSLVSVLPYFSDMSNMYVNISLGMTTSSAPSMSQSVVNT